MTRNFNPTCNYEYGKIMADDRDVENFNEGLGFLLQLLNPLDKEMDGLPDAVVDSGIEEVVSRKIMEKTHLNPFIRIISITPIEASSQKLTGQSYLLQNPSFIPIQMYVLDITITISTITCHILARHVEEGFVNPAI